MKENEYITDNRLIKSFEPYPLPSYTKKSPDHMNGAQCCPFMNGESYDEWDQLKWEISEYGLDKVIRARKEQKEAEEKMNKYREKIMNGDPETIALFTILSKAMETIKEENQK